MNAEDLKSDASTLLRTIHSLNGRLITCTKCTPRSNEMAARELSEPFCIGSIHKAQHVLAWSMAAATPRLRRKPRRATIGAAP